MIMHPQLKNPKLYFMILTDIAIFVLALYGSYLIRWETLSEPFPTLQILHLLLWIVPLKLAVFFFFGLYRGMWRYTSVRDFWALARACFLSTVLVMLILLATKRFMGYSRAVFVIDLLLTFILTGGVRMAIRSYFAGRMSPEAIARMPDKIQLTRVLIIGAGAAGEKILREILDNYTLHYDVVG